jgi:hypothetical protein
MLTSTLNPASCCAFPSTQLTVFLTQPIQDPSFGLTVYISPPPYQKWLYLGAVSNNLPSNVLQVRWPPAFVTQPFQAQLGMCVSCISCVSCVRIVSYGQ